jgi:hypothetical protein
MIIKTCRPKIKAETRNASDDNGRDQTGDASHNFNKQLLSKF